MIDWMEWGADAFARARDEGKPVLLSLTAAWCHACHRMDDETWDNPAVAREVARLAVPVRVDADARPDLYQRYHLGGLPTTLLLTAAGEPITGGTYLEVPQLLAILNATSGALPPPLTPPLSPKGRGSSAAIPSPHRGEGQGEGVTADRVDLVAGFLALLARRADAVNGGFGVAPKRPEPEAIALLLRHARATGDAASADLARRALDAIAEHLADPVEGGFYRYAEGADWSGAHTEKLATEQAALIGVFLEGAVALGEVRYVEVARRAGEFVAARLLSPEGHVRASLAAAPEYYRDERRDEEEAPAVDGRRFLDAEAAMVSAAVAGSAFDLGASRRPPHPGPPTNPPCGRVAGGEREKGGHSREGAPHPSPLPLAGERGFGVVASFLGLAPEAVPHRLDGGAGEAAGLLGDVALAIQAAVDVYRGEGRREALAWAVAAAEWAAAELWDEARGAFRDAPAGAAAGMPAMPALMPVLNNGRMAYALVQLADHLGDDARDAHRARARRVTDALAAAALRSPAGAALALARQRLDAPPTLIDRGLAPGGILDGGPD